MTTPHLRKLPVYHRSPRRVRPLLQLLRSVCVSLSVARPGPFVQMRQKVWLKLNLFTGKNICIYNIYVEVSKQHQYMNQRHQIL